MTSILIEKKAEVCGEPAWISATNELTLLRFPDGVEVIETNGDPVWESDTGFDELKLTIADWNK